MNQGPLTADELEWLDDVLTKYGNEDSVLDVSELDGFITAILSAPNGIEPERWLAQVWGGEENAPNWDSEEEPQRFVNLTFQHMNDVADRLCHYPEQFEPLFGTQEIEDQEFTVVEEWCFGYMRGVALDDWSALPEALQPSLATIAVHGTEEGMEKLDAMSPEQFVISMEKILPAALRLHAFWMSKRA